MDLLCARLETWLQCPVVISIHWESLQLQPFHSFLHKYRQRSCPSSLDGPLGPCWLIDLFSSYLIQNSPHKNTSGDILHTAFSECRLPYILLDTLVYWVICINTCMNKKCSNSFWRSVQGKALRARIREDGRIDDGIERQKRMLNVRANMISGSFNRCTTEVKRTFDLSV